MTIDKLIDVLNNNCVSLCAGRRCVDGRYQGKSLPSCARPGADVGYLMESLAAVRQLQQTIDDKLSLILDNVVECLGGPEEFYLHTDDHADNIAAGGCGHVRLARQNPDKYGLTAPDMMAINQKLDELVALGAKVTVLSGQHQEKAVVVVEHPELNLAHKLNENEQVFVYHKAIDEQNRHQIVDSLAAKLGLDPEQLYQSFCKVSDLQTSATLAELAKDLPIHSVTQTAGQVTIVLNRQ